jgi:flagellar protein FlaG
MAIKDIKTFSTPNTVYARQNKIETKTERNSALRETGSAPTADRVNAKEFTVAIEKVKELAKGLNRNLNFSIDRDTGKTVVRIVDADNGEVVRQIPSEEFLALSKNLNELQGMLLHAEA